MFYTRHVGVEYREEPCKVALNRVQGMPFKWSLNPYMGCVHRCTFCYVRAFEQRADRPSTTATARSIRVKINVADVLARELARPSWSGETVTIGAATDPYQPAEGRYRLTRACIERSARPRTRSAIITRGPMIVRDVDVLAEAARRATVSVTFSIPTLDEDVWRKTEPVDGPPAAAAARAEAARRRGDQGERRHGADPPRASPTDPEQMAEVVRAAREAGATGVWANVLFLRPGTREHFLEHLAEDWPELVPLYEQLYARRAYLGGEHTQAGPRAGRRAGAALRDRGSRAGRSAPSGGRAARPRGLVASSTDAPTIRKPVEASPLRTRRRARDHVPDRRRPRGRARGAAALALARARTSA